MFFFAGHGVRVGDENYLLPIDADVKTPDEVKWEAIPLSLALEAMRGRSLAKLAFLDACRTNLMDDDFKRALGLDRGAAGGLAETQKKPEGAYIGFATRAGAPADDGSGLNSPFTAALVKHMPRRGIIVQEMMTYVRAEVLDKTGRRQRPSEMGELDGLFYFAPGAPPAAAAQASTGISATVSQLAIAAAEWAQIKDTGSIAVLKRFAEHFKDTYYGALAGDAVAALEAAAARAEVDRLAAEEEQRRQDAQARAEAEAKARAGPKRRRSRGGRRRGACPSRRVWRAGRSVRFGSSPARAKASRRLRRLGRRRGLWFQRASS
ncbi:MAG: caspase family protein [Hyphomicrobiales bacterium]|nr:caspase family protein [Hyphomicrobiales bacterium]